jgi:hypothetical protein
LRRRAQSAVDRGGGAAMFSSSARLARAVLKLVPCTMAVLPDR